ncbi:MAG: glycosyltransferase family 2 protein [Thermoanaerobaculia bacterium]
MRREPAYSAVIPVFNSAEIIELTTAACSRFFEENLLTYELLLIDDGSTDQTWPVLEQIAATNNHVIAVRLLRNYGQHDAVHCGLSLSRGEYVVVLDDDLQNPPSEIIHLIKKAEDGYDVVFGKFRRKQHSLIRRLGSWGVNWINTAVFDKPATLVLTNFKLLRRSVVARILTHRTSMPYINGLAILYAQNPGDVTVEHNERLQGKSNYTLRRLVSLALRVLFGYSLLPIRCATTLGLIASTIGILYGAVTRHFTMTLFSIMHCAVVILLGTIGEYVVRALTESSMKPYHVAAVARHHDD